jgi:aminoglycoside-2''-adenylyltransferase
VDLAPRQLTSLDRVARLLEARSIDYWLFGGWAVDLYAGSITRPHSDIDLAIWFDDLSRIVQLLEWDGWRHAPDDHEDGGTGFERDGVRLELTFLVRDDAGDVSMPMRDGPVPWDRAAFGDDERALEGVRARVITLEALRGMKAWPRGDAEDEAKDRADLDALPSG